MNYVIFQLDRDLKRPVIGASGWIQAISSLHRGY
jgi:hypothetical protein